MKTLGYIYTKNKIKFDFIETISSLSAKKDDKPCLIVGLSEAKKYASDNFSILEKQFSDGNFWTFGKTEKREDYEKDLNNFYNNIINNNFKNIKYYYINLFNIKYNVLKRLIKLYTNSNRKYIYIWNDMIYVLCNDNSVVGFSLKIAKYCGINPEKIVNKIKSNKNNIIKYDDNFIDKHLKNKIKHNNYIVPYIMYLME